MVKRLSFLSIVALVMLIGAFAISSTFSIGNGSAHATANNTTASLELDSVIDISAPSTITMNCTPGSTDATSELCTSNATISVSTNNVNGYTLQMNIAEGYSPHLTNSAVSPAAIVSALNLGSYAPANFPADRWGYTGGLDKSGETGGYDCSTEYCRVYEIAYSGAPNHVIKETDAPSNASATTITFAGKVTTAKPSGTYSTSVTFTAIANEAPYSGIEEGMLMQDIDSAVCGATPFYSESGEVYTVFDEREEYYLHPEEVRNMGYTVAKLEDGNCWMTQNLFLGGPEAIILTPADTNVASDFTLPASVSEGDWDGDPDVPELFDYVSIEYDPSTTKYGNYYNWAAATAGSGTSATTSGDAQYSICPKNWHLPSAGTAATTGNEFYTMLSNYVTTGTWDDSDPDYPYWYNVTIASYTNIPVSLVFSGFYYEDLGGQGQGGGGDWWSSTAHDSGGADGLDAGSNGDLSPRSNFSKVDGLSIRCLISGA